MEIRFKRKMTGFVGVERERFLSKGTKIVPRAEEFLAIIKDPLWTYELSACQIEDRTPPLQGIDKIKAAQKAGEITDDAMHDNEGEIQKLTDRHIKTIDEHVEKKEAEIMTV